MTYDYSSNSIKFKNNFDSPGQYIANLEIQLEDSQGKKSKNIPFKVVIIKKPKVLLCTHKPKTIEDSKLIKEKTTCGKDDFVLQRFET